MTMNLNMRARTVAAATAVATSLLLFALPARAEMKIQEVKSSSGVSAWLVEDYSAPIISIRFSFEGGTTQDPNGKDGLTTLMTGMLDEGAGKLDSEAFQSRLDDAGAEMQFSAGRDSISGSMRTLADQKADSFELLRMAINEPRFDKEPLERIRAQMVSGILAAAHDPEAAAQVKWANALYGDHPYARHSEGTEESLASMKADDLRALHKAIFARQKLKVAVVGAIDPATLKTDLNKLFGNLPEKPALQSVPDVQAKLGQELHVDYPLPQTSITFAYPGVSRDDPNFFGAVLMNHILGGGTFSSRLFDEVREKRGLTYGISSSLMNQAHSSGLMISTSTRVDKAGETLDVIHDVVDKMAKNGPEEAELADAKKYLVGSYAINNLDSSTSIASTLVDLQVEKLGIDYMQRRAELINAVTVDDVKAAARKLLSVKPSVLIVGTPMATAASMGSKG
ncbi:zinc protease [Mesorhizobium soli]|uniref:M16 family metallopeptidase n=1 Tax=Pseudaminobacter soli (ex Li et al. 2025) TaxID=1295366 RepID=UPI0024735590|nr:pitrilysin family protein [Mesorhizobium soli]MDH6229877.1 zinc protease [Mesorhizobium soli]